MLQGDALGCCPQIQNADKNVKEHDQPSAMSYEATISQAYNTSSTE